MKNKSAIQSLLPSNWKINLGYLVTEDGCERYILKDDGTIDANKIVTVLENYDYKAHARTISLTLVCPDCALISKAELNALFAVVEAVKPFYCVLNRHEKAISESIEHLNSITKG